MNTITQIIDVRPYQITAKFNTGEIRTINFSPLIETFTVLKNPEVFLKAKIDDYPTISWDGLAQIGNWMVPSLNVRSILVLKLFIS